MNLTSRSPEATRSRTKWKSISMCFVLAWKTGFAVRYVAPRLSHHKMAVCCRGTRSSFKTDSIHIASATPFPKALYSASVLDLETVGCFLALHEIKFGPTKTANPLVERRSSTSPAQSASLKILTPVSLDLRIRSHVSSVPLTYRNIRLTASQCKSVGCDKNWHTLFTAKDKSGRVSVKYCNPPTMLRYLVESSVPSNTPDSRARCSVVTRGVEVGRQFSILTR
jgi:hypothetical protein